MTDSSLWLPLLTTLVALVTTLAVFWAWSKRAPPAKKTRGTRIVTDSEGNNVRRSTRCVCRPARFEMGRATSKHPTTDGFGSSPAQRPLIAGAKCPLKWCRIVVVGPGS